MFWLDQCEACSFLVELMREKLGTKLKLGVELDFRKRAGVLSCIYSQGEQKKCLSHGSVWGWCSSRNQVSGIGAPGSLPKSVPALKGRFIIYLNLWNSSVHIHVTVSWTYCDLWMWQADASGWANSPYERLLSHEMADTSCRRWGSCPAICKSSTEIVAGRPCQGQGTETKAWGSARKWEQ